MPSGYHGQLGSECATWTCSVEKLKIARTISSAANCQIADSKWTISRASMSNFEVPSPILRSPDEEPKEHGWILEGHPTERRPGRRSALYFYREPARDADQRGGLASEMKLVNRIRETVKPWRGSGCAGGWH